MNKIRLVTYSGIIEFKDYDNPKYLQSFKIPAIKRIISSEHSSISFDLRDSTIDDFSINLKCGQDNIWRGSCLNNSNSLERNSDSLKNILINGDLNISGIWVAEKDKSYPFVVKAAVLKEEEIEEEI